MGRKGSYDDRDLIKRCVMHDAEAWALLAERYSKLMRAAIKKQLDRCGFPHAVHEIDDILQETLTAVWSGNSMAAVKNAPSLPYWLAMVSSNTALSYMRNKKHEEQLDPIITPENEDAAGTLSSILQCGPIPRDELSRCEVSGKIDEAIENLPANERIVIKLFFLYEKKYHEISEILGMPANTVSSCVRRGRGKLKEALKHFFNFFATILPILASYIVGGRI